MKQKINYIHSNAVVEGLVDKEEEYLYSSARDNHETGKRNNRYPDFVTAC